MDVKQKCQFSTPDLSHATSTDFEHVYEPAEDSFLMLDALEKDYDVLKTLQCSDVNPKAAELTRQTARQNGVVVHPVVCDLSGAIEDRLRGQVDVLLFNPPYVVTPTSEVSSGAIEASWAGGVKGREVTDRFLPTVAQLLSPAGLFYLIVIKENVVDEIEAIMKKYEFHMTTIISRKAGREHLSVLKFARSK